MRFWVFQHLPMTRALKSMHWRGRPGVYSARYAGENGNADANRALLLAELADHTNRAAHFRTVLAFIADGEMHRFEGSV